MAVQQKVTCEDMLFKQKIWTDCQRGCGKTAESQSWNSKCPPELW